MYIPDTWLAIDHSCVFISTPRMSFSRRRESIFVGVGLEIGLMFHRSISRSYRSIEICFLPSIADVSLDYRCSSSSCKIGAGMTTSEAEVASMLLY